MFMKYMVTKQRSVSLMNDEIMHHLSAIALIRYLVQKKEVSGAFTILYTIGLLYFVKTLCNFGANINFMPPSL